MFLREQPAQKGGDTEWVLDMSFQVIEGINLECRKVDGEALVCWCLRTSHDLCKCGRRKELIPSKEGQEGEVRAVVEERGVGDRGV